MYFFFFITFNMKLKQLKSMTIKRSSVFIISLLLLFFLQSCSLLKLELETEAVPLNKKELKARRLLNDYAREFFHDVRSAADTIFDETDSRDIQINALVWKIAATSEVKNKAFQEDPVVALIDVWMLAGNLSDYFKSAEGKELFREYQSVAVTTSDLLLYKIDTIARSVFMEGYPNAKILVDKYRAEKPFKDFDFYMESSFDKWYKDQQISDSIANVDKGTMPQVMKNFSNKILLGSEQTLYEAQWGTELIFKKSKLDSLNIQKISDEFNQNLDQMIDVIRESGKTMQSDAEIFHRDFKLLVKNMNQNLDSVSLIFREELGLFREDLSTEREAVMLSIDQTSEKVAKTVMEEFHDMVKDLMIYIVILLIIILVVPFTIGFFTGKIYYRKRDQDNRD